MILCPFTLCKITFKPIKLIADYYTEKCSSWPGLVGENNHFTSKCTYFQEYHTLFDILFHFMPTLIIADG